MALDAWHLRMHEPGDIGWIIYRHGLLYAHEYGFDTRFEALVAQIGATFLREFDPLRERCWIAESDGGERLGSVMLVRHTDDEAKLRLLLVEPAARGLGVGRALVDACVAFAREVGYARVVLWTNVRLTAACRIYAAAGFRVIRDFEQDSFGAVQHEQHWALDLTQCDD